MFNISNIGAYIVAYKLWLIFRVIKGPNGVFSIEADIQYTGTHRQELRLVTFLTFLTDQQVKL